MHASLTFAAALLEMASGATAPPEEAQLDPD